jgi:Flp pilus assembly protein TadD
MRLICALLLLSFITACALPRESVRSGFIEDKERYAVMKAREGLAYFARGRMADAEFALREALYLKPDAQNIRFNLATVLKASQQFDESQQILEQLIAKFPADLEYRETFARMLFERGDLLESKRQFAAILDSATAKNDPARAARVSRTIAQLSFRVGDERTAVCASEEAYLWTRTEVEQMEHARLLMAANRTRALLQFAVSSGSAGPILYYAQLAAYDVGDLKQAREFMLQQPMGQASDQALRTQLAFLKLLVSEKEVAAETLEEKGLAALQGNSKANLLWPVKLYTAAQKIKAHAELQ